MHLLVIPNPFTALDVNGLPCGFCFVDPQHARPFQVVGGTLGRKVLPHDDMPEGAERDPEDLRESRVKVRTSVKLAAVPVQNTEYHRARIACGDLIAVDRETAAVAGIGRDAFLPPAQVMSDTLALRIVEWMAEHGGELPACATLGFEQIGEGAEMKLFPSEGQLQPAPADGKELRLFVPPVRLPARVGATTPPQSASTAPAGTEPAPKALGPKKTPPVPSVG